MRRFIRFMGEAELEKYLISNLALNDEVSSNKFFGQMKNA